jgi:hypothetical protein
MGYVKSWLLKKKKKNIGGGNGRIPTDMESGAKHHNPNPM